MSYTKVSTKYQVVIPKDIRQKMSIKPGQKMSVIVKNGIINMIPDKPMEFYRGFLLKEKKQNDMK